LPKGPAPIVPVQARAHLEVQNGCDHRCTFCIIPFGRGQARSKMVQDIVEEAQLLVDRGTKEIVLTGVDLTSYGPDLGSSVSLSDPIKALLKALPPFIRLRLSSIDGAEVDDQLFSLIVNEARIAPHLHLSLQAGDNMILKRMKRRHTREEAIALCQRLKAQRPEIVFGADIIAGFPTETEAMFQNSLNLVTECELTYLHVFPYSPRTGTPAALMPQMERAVIKDRATRLRQLADDRLAQHLHSKLRQTDEMLVEQVKNGQVFGRLADFTEVVTQGPFTAGDVFLIHPTEIDGHRLRAHPV
ncbi:MAG: MiaB/RimO family radical SAM methylthiotransferase, partial [Pseudomonadota bacterium]